MWQDTERLPGLTDMEHMPYVHAYAKELLRWRPIFVSMPDHMLTQDVEFEGYSFPAGTHALLSTRLDRGGRSTRV